MGRNSIHDKADAAKRAHAMSRPRWRWPSLESSAVIVGVVAALWVLVEITETGPATVVPRDETEITEQWIINAAVAAKQDSLRQHYIIATIDAVGSQCRSHSDSLTLSILLMRLATATKIEAFARRPGFNLQEGR